MAKVDNCYKWDLSGYFKNDEEWESAFCNYSKKIEEIKKFCNKLNDAQTILDCLKFLEDLDCMAEPLYIYAHCKKDLDVTNSISQQRMNKIESKLTEHFVATSFVVPQISKLSNEFLKLLILQKDFENYKKPIDDIIREKSHVLSEECENLISGVSAFTDAFSTTFSNFEDGDLVFNKVKNSKGKDLDMTQSLASIYLRDKDEVLRKNAYIELNSAFGRYNNFLFSNYLASVKKDVFLSKARKFNSCIEKALFNEKVDAKVYNTLIETVEENLKIEHDLLEVKRKMLNLKKYNIYDVYYAPLKTLKKYSYEQAFDLVCETLKLLGDDYISELLHMKNSGKIDVYPDKNKANGAYKTGCYKKPAMVLTNFSGKFNDVSTLAHELGHAMHSFYSDKDQPYYTSNYPIFLAEIASTVNETLLNAYMIEKTTEESEKLFYINEFLSTFHATVFRQTMFASFESLTHKMVENNEPISSEIFNERYLNLVKKYFGKKVNVLDCVKYEWSRIPHFYTSFYVYKYATGLISAINIVMNLKDGIISVEDYKKFLGSGCSKDPVSLLKIVKVDLTKKSTFDRAFEYLNSYILKAKNILKNSKKNKKNRWQFILCLILLQSIE